MKNFLFLIIFLSFSPILFAKVEIEHEVHMKEGGSWNIVREKNCYNLENKECVSNYNTAEMNEDIVLKGDRPVMTALHGFHFLSQEANGGIKVEVFTKVQAISKKPGQQKNKLVLTESKFPIVLQSGVWNELIYIIGKKERKLRFRVLP